ncbi:Homeodomain-like domain [Phytophthora infestans]|uniref:Homeodomain-like domain n=1 Tax=Phytophthora infestans TaxID=4787 RepID=A0A8S9THK7_PHYIN|nr:Homeodomain-like domain [Phytophthora infestans]
MYSADFRWRAITLHYAYSVPCEQVSRSFGVSGRTVRRWYKEFKSSGHVMPDSRDSSNVRDPEVLAFVSKYAKEHPCFYVEELQAALRIKFGADKTGLSASSILRLLKFELRLSRKVLERRAREAEFERCENLICL